MTERTVEVPRATERSAFDRFAEATTHFVSHGLFFVSVVLVVIWFPTIVVFASVDAWQLVINTFTSVLAFC
jgi:low affinity Fe/Cu permease